MARSRKASLETKVMRVIKGALPVVVGVGAVGLGIRYFGDKPVISDIAEGLNGNVKGSSFFGFLGF
ncbi:MAG: hypothetical protein JKY93_03160 [Gammaproteobacteria bacterium]|nr:hypothetical protein [Gammaproteobacteria bacterium]